jgi:hypothetical protein
MKRKLLHFLKTLGPPDFEEVGGLEWSKDPKSYAGGS